ncbi:hypothetical protein [Streptomyces sp. cmx-18-6]|uniref:hypothetical protein n=1 Tax=Streptomyces sp. cmx-18-6 TaxID=2790930 RepID=UPI00397E967D
MPRPPQRIWSGDEWERIQLGYASRGMDEKWNVFTEGDTVFLHRSWTGRGIFAATFAPVDDGGWRITDAVAERDPERYGGTDDAYDCVMLELVLSAIVLGEPAADLRAKLVESTSRNTSSADVPAGLVQHSAVGLRSDSPTDGRSVQGG